MNAAPAKGLGKGLSALMGEDYSKTMGEGSKSLAGNSSQPVRLFLEEIHSSNLQPRTKFSEEYLNELANSIEKNGVMQPIVVRPSTQHAGKYEIIAGERRWRASKLAKIADIPVIIRDIDDKVALELALVENVQRQDLSPLEEAAGYQRLMSEFSYTQDYLSKTIGKSRSHIANLLRLLTLPDAIKSLLDSDQLSMGHARALLNAPNPLQLAEEVIKRGLNVRQTENLVRTGLPDTSKLANKKPHQHSGHASDDRGAIRQKDPDILALEETLSENLGLNVSINDRGAQKGEVVIQYTSLSQLDEILRRLGESI